MDTITITSIILSYGYNMNFRDVHSSWKYRIYSLHWKKFVKYAFAKGSFNNIKYLHDVIGLTLDDFDSKVSSGVYRTLINLCCNVELIKYVIEVMGLKLNIPSINHLLCHNVCREKCLETLKYLVEVQGFTSKDFYCRNIYMCCFTGFVAYDDKILDYLNNVVGVDGKSCFVKKYFN